MVNSQKNVLHKQRTKSQERATFNNKKANSTWLAEKKGKRMKIILLAQARPVARIGRKWEKQTKPQHCAACILYSGNRQYIDRFVSMWQTSENKTVRAAISCITIGFANGPSASVASTLEPQHTTHRPRINNLHFTKRVNVMHSSGSVCLTQMLSSFLYFGLHSFFCMVTTQI